jgi:hypothetical protein
LIFVLEQVLPTSKATGGLVPTPSKHFVFVKDNTLPGV